MNTGRLLFVSTAAVISFTALTLTACSSAPKEPAPLPHQPARSVTPAPPPPPMSSAAKSGEKAQPSQPAVLHSKLLSRPIKPMPVVPLNVSADCKFRNETGYNGETVLEVKEGNVQRMHTVVNVPDRGQCIFELADMQQTKVLPSIELRGKQVACIARMWEQGHKVTLAFSDCSARCSSGTFEYVWPVLIDKQTGKCE